MGCAMLAGLRVANHQLHYLHQCPLSSNLVDLPFNNGLLVHYGSRYIQKYILHLYVYPFPSHQLKTHAMICPPDAG